MCELCLHVVYYLRYLKLRFNQNKTNKKKITWLDVLKIKHNDKNKTCM